MTWHDIARFFGASGQVDRAQISHAVELEVQRRAEGHLHPDFQQAHRARLSPPRGRRTLGPLAGLLDCLPRLSDSDLDLVASCLHQTAEL